MARIDHVFVFTRPGAPERSQLQAHGLQIGAERKHDGQGTANICFGFANSYLEMIWLDDDEAARHVMVKPLGLHERAAWREYRASPFGVCVRTDDGEAVPFAHWDYTPDYLPAGTKIEMGCNSGVIGEPLLFRIARPFEAMTTQHSLSGAKLQSVRITTPDLAPMSLLHELQVDGLTCEQGNEHLMEVTLSGAAESGELDLRPDLPLVLRW